MVNKLVPCGGTCARFAHMLSSDPEDYAPWWPAPRTYGRDGARPSIVLRPDAALSLPGRTWVLRFDES